MGKREVSSAKKQIKPVLSLKKRNELSQLIDKLLRVSTVTGTQQQVSVTNAWDLNGEINEMLTKVINIESVIDNRKSSFSERRTSSASIDKFVSWMTENGGKFDELSIEQFAGYELGLKTNRDITEGSLILSVPRKLMLTIESAEKSKMYSLIQRDTMLQNMQNIALAMFLFGEKFTETSFWKPYIDILPSTYTTVLYFTRDDLAELKDSPTLLPALNLIKSIARQYAYFKKLIDVLAAEEPAAELLKNHFTYEQYRWAVSSVMTRQNSIPSADGSHMINALIPLWDLCNHTNGYISTEYNSALEMSECLALKDFNAGQQVFIFYGIRPNAELFIHNGFVYEDNIHDGYWLKLGLSKSDRLYEKRSLLLDRIKIPTHGEFCLKCGSDPIAGKLLGFVRIFNMNEDQLDDWLCGDNSASNLLYHQDCAVETELENKSWKFVQTRLQLILATYRTTLSTDHELLSSSSSHAVSCKKLAIRMRATEKRILQHALNYVSQRINQ